MPLLGQLTASSSQFANKRGIYLGRRSTKIHVALYRRTGGRIGSHLPGWTEARIALVDHTGAKSGAKRTSPLMYHEDGDAIAVTFEDGAIHKLSSPWIPGVPLWQGTIDAAPVAMHVRMIPNGFELAYRGVEAKAFVYTEREARYARLMPVKVLSDSGKAVRCPMPGLVASITVGEGQEVKAGETLAVVEAMKMENILRAERDGTIKKIRVKKGDSVAVDAVIMEFA